MKILFSTFDKYNIKYEKVKAELYMLEWLDSSKKEDFDIILQIKNNVMNFYIPLGRLSGLDKEKRYEMQKIVSSSLAGLSIKQMPDGDVMLGGILQQQHSERDIILLIMEICRFKQILSQQYAFADKIIPVENTPTAMRIIHCDLCGNKSDNIHIINGIEVCQDCYLHFPRCASCNKVIGHDLNNTFTFDGERFCKDCFATQEKCIICKKPLNIIHACDKNTYQSFCFDCNPRYPELNAAEIQNSLTIVINIIKDIFVLPVENFYYVEIVPRSFIDKRTHTNSKYTGLFTGNKIYIAEGRTFEQYVYIIAHEYFHYLQRKYAPGWRIDEIVEGFAEWGETVIMRYLKDAHSFRRYNELLSGKRPIREEYREYDIGYLFFQKLEAKLSIEEIWNWMKKVKSGTFEDILNMENITLL